MFLILYRILRSIIKMIAFPWVLLKILRPSLGKEYNIGLCQKTMLVFRVMMNAISPASATTFYEQLYLVCEVLKIPKGLDGVIAEFGCYKGMSTSSLSLACKLTNRLLLVFDSFEGLPFPETMVTNIGKQNLVLYKQGQYKCSLDDVKTTVAKYGDIGSCQFIKGFFEYSLPKYGLDFKYLLVFEDADLPQSVRETLKHIWPRLLVGCSFFSHEALDYDVVKIFYDDFWWNNNFNCRSPGFVGGGTGLALSPNGSKLGYAVKLEDVGKE